MKSTDVICSLKFKSVSLDCGAIEVGKRNTDFRYCLLLCICMSFIEVENTASKTFCTKSRNLKVMSQTG